MNSLCTDEQFVHTEPSQFCTLHKGNSLYFREAKTCVVPRAYKREEVMQQLASKN